MARQSSRRSHQGNAARMPRKAQPPAASPAHNNLATASSPTHLQPSQGFFSRVAETATGVAVGHVVGRAFTGAVSTIFGSGPETHSELPPQNKDAPKCSEQMSQFLDCMDRNRQDSTACQFYLDLLGQCRSGNVAEAFY